APRSMHAVLDSTNRPRITTGLASAPATSRSAGRTTPFTIVAETELRPSPVAPARRPVARPLSVGSVAYSTPERWQYAEGSKPGWTVADATLETRDSGGQPVIASGTYQPAIAITSSRVSGARRTSPRPTTSKPSASAGNCGSGGVAAAAGAAVAGAGGSTSATAGGSWRMPASPAS